MASDTVSPTDLDVVAERLTGILGLALTLGHSASISDMADTEAMNAVIGARVDADTAAVMRRARLDPASPGFDFVIKSALRTADDSWAERQVSRRLPHARTASAMVSS